MMELSTSIPTPSASPPSDMMLSETPKASIRAKVPTTEMGIASATATGYRGSRRKRKRTRKASIPPRTSAETTLSMESAMNPAWELATSMVTSGNSRLEELHHLLHVAGHLHRVRPALLEDEEPHRLPAVVAGEGLPVGEAVHHPPHVAHPDRPGPPGRGPLLGHHHVVDLATVRNSPRVRSG
jgi:hypothetical protein